MNHRFWGNVVSSCDDALSLTTLYVHVVPLGKVLDDCAEELRKAVEDVSGIGKLPKITFVRGE